MESANIRQQGLLALFDHIGKPVIESLSLRGGGGASLVPTEAQSLQIRNNLNLRSQGIGTAPRGKPCSLFKWENMQEAFALALLFTKIEKYDDFVRTTVAVRSAVNEEVYTFALMYASLHRSDTRDLGIPPTEEIMPHWYFPTTVITQADIRVKAAANEEERIVVPYEWSHNERDPEFRVAYFREDITLNSHHWHWHLAYPYVWLPSQGGTKDRKGELFYYMHQQVMARYDAERLCNNLNRVTPLNDFRKPLDLGYFPNLISTNSGTLYPGRPANMLPSDLNDISLDRMELWKDRILEAIHTRAVTDSNNKRTTLEDPTGIDMLGSIVESAALSANRAFYGDFHNRGHVIIAQIHDPDGKYGADSGVMGFSSTAMRDPIFYRWHKAIDNIFNEYKLTLPHYTRQELTWPKVILSHVSIKSNTSKKSNFVQTYWQEREILLSRNVDFGRANPVVVSARHLQHESFVFELEVDNQTGGPQEGLVRLFMAPVLDELNDPLTLHEQRRLFFELDKFQVKLKAGRQVVTRKSEESNVTLAAAKGFEQLAAGGEPEGNDGFCGCGWPEHLLLPKGRPEGSRYTLFAMVTDWSQDKVESPAPPTKKTCSDAASYCGIRDQLYPDKRAMGFPWDRGVGRGTTLDDFLTANMSTREVSVRHSGEVVAVRGVYQPQPVF